MSNKPKAYFEFHFCFQEPNGDEVIGWDIYFSWRIPGIANSMAEIERGQRSSECVLRAESNLIFDDIDFESVPMFKLRYSPNQTHIVLRRGRDRFRTRLTGCGSGGNWYWEVFLVPAFRQAHLLNWLRRSKHFSINEWNTKFRETIWNKRGHIQVQDLRRFKQVWIDEAIKQDQERRSGFAYFNGVSLGKVTDIRVHPCSSVVKKSETGETPIPLCNS